MFIILIEAGTKIINIFAKNLKFCNTWNQVSKNN